MLAGFDVVVKLDDQVIHVHEKFLSGRGRHIEADKAEAVCNHELQDILRLLSLHHACGVLICLCNLSAQLKS